MFQSFLYRPRLAEGGAFGRRSDRDHLQFERNFFMPFDEEEEDPEEIKYLE